MKPDDKRLLNLKPFKKGDKGNPKGRPKSLPKLDELLAQILGEKKDGVTAAEAILAALRAKAAKGDIKAAQLLLDRAYGKSKETIAIDHTTKGDKIIWHEERTYEANDQADQGA